ncbi:MAG: 16S rRNA (cytidine(1402)-2'-O)-methyltransferase [Clostridiales bacterium]|nr:16S rRNA (cytidine(1402)-2'-O)-methyltransferase [Clostridiales bacterium]
MGGKLYVVGTPIGNLGDFSPRAVKTLSECDFIAAEDTRVTVKILNHFGIKKAMVSYHEHNRVGSGERIIDRITAGETCALVTDAGMPAVSDPGEDLVRLCHERGVKVEAVPGPCAFTSALAISGMPSGRFTFEGFLSMNKPSRREHLLSLKDEKRTMIFYEAPHKLPATLADMYSVFGDRRISIVREITKIYEEVINTTLGYAAENFANGEIKGEIVLIIGGAPEDEKEDFTLSDAAAMAAELMKSENMSPSDASKAAAKKTGFKKGDIYKMIIGEEH